MRLRCARRGVRVVEAHGSGLRHRPQPRGQVRTGQKGGLGLKGTRYNQGLWSSISKGTFIYQPCTITGSTYCNSLTWSSNDAYLLSTTVCVLSDTALVRPCCSAGVSELLRLLLVLLLLLAPPLLLALLVVALLVYVGWDGMSVTTSALSRWAAAKGSNELARGFCRVGAPALGRNTVNCM